MTSRQRGVALILCLVLMAVFFAMASYVTGKQQQQLKLFMGLQQKVELDYLAESTLQQLNFSVVTNAPFVMNNEEYKLNGIGEVVELNNGVELTINDGYGVLSLVPFDKEAFIKLVDGIADDTGAGAKLAARILDWQDNDNLQRLNGREASLSGNDDYQPRNYMLQSLSEVKLVDGMTDSLFRQLEPYLIYYKITPFDERAAGDKLRTLLDLPQLTRKIQGHHTQVNGLDIALKQPLVVNINIKGEYASLQQKYFIHYWPTLNQLWGYSEYGE